MRRRDVLAALAGATAAPWRARASQRRTPVIGYLYAGSLATNRDNVAALWRGLAEFGYVEGRNAEAEYRDAQNEVGRLPELARELVRREVSVIAVPGGGPGLSAARAATATIPIVFSNAGDPIRLGYVTSLTRPGGNVTGISDFGIDLSAKRLEVIKLLVPAVSRIGILLTRNYAGLAGESAKLRQSAPALSLETVASVAGDQQEIDAAFDGFAQQGVDGLCVPPSPLFFSRREQIVALAAAPSPAGDLPVDPVCPGGRPRQLWHQQSGTVVRGGPLRRPDPERGESGRPPGPPPVEIRTGHQHAHRQDAGLGGAGPLPRADRSGHRLSAAAAGRRRRAGYLFAASFT